MKTTISLLSALLILISCGEKKTKTYTPNGLRKLANKEIIDNLINGKVFNPAEIVYKNNHGYELSMDSLVSLLKKGESFGDQYVNEKDSVVEMIVRPMVDNDKILLEQIDSVRVILMEKQKQRRQQQIQEALQE